MDSPKQYTDAEDQAAREKLLHTLTTEAFEEKLAAAELIMALHQALIADEITPEDITLEQENQLLSFSVWAANTRAPKMEEIRELGRYAREIADAAHCLRSRK